MAKRFNSASRVYNMLMKLDDNKYQRIQPLDFWAEILDVAQENTSRKAAEVTNKLNILHDELALVRTGMEHTDFSEYLYCDALKNLEQVISVLYLQTNWQSVAQFLKPEALLSLNFCSEILPDEAQQLSDSDVDELQRLLEELKSELDVRNLPDSLERLIRKHISVIEKAIHDYKIQGYRAVEQAVSSIVGDITIEEKIFRDSVNDSSLISKVGGVYTKFMEPVLGKINPVLGIVNSLLGISQHVS
jgi:hypothetical protein